MSEPGKSLSSRIYGKFTALADARARHAQDKALLRRFGPPIANLSAKGRAKLVEIATVLDRLGAPMGTIYDIGAFDGMWSEAFAIYCRGNVICFEPLPDMCKQVQACARRTPGIKVQPVACGTTASTAVMRRDSHKVAASSLLEMADIHKSEFPLTGKSSETPVQIVRLDDWVNEKALPLPDLIKIDVQGYELDVLSGGEATVRAARHVWIELNFEEFYIGGSTFDRTYRRLCELGFELIELIDPIRSRTNGRLLYVDGIFRNRHT